MSKVSPCEPASAKPGDPAGLHPGAQPGELDSRRLGLVFLYYLGAMGLLHVSLAAGLVALTCGVLIFWRTLARLVARHLVGSWRLLNLEAALVRKTANEGHALDPRLPIVFATCAVTLTLIEYFGGSETFSILARRIDPRLVDQRYFKLWGLAYWSGFRLLFYVGLPALVLRLFLPGERLRDYGLSSDGFVSHLKLYALLYLIVLPPVLVASTTRPFQRTYPFYKLAGRSWGDFFAWEALYTVQFFALELFFRGFMLHPLKATLGGYAIFAMALPYCMIHYDKPLVEAAGAFLAGTVLGTLSLRTRSIWAGVLIHATVAITMDALAVFHTAGYPGNPQFVG